MHPQDFRRDSFASYDRNLIDLSIFANASLDSMDYDDKNSDDSSTEHSISSFDYDLTEEGDENEHEDSATSLNFEVIMTNPSKRKKRVWFGGATLREYAVTVGALTASKGPCPCQLSWEHSEDIEVPLSNESGTNRPVVRRLTHLQRRERIARVQGVSVKQVLGIEFENTRQSIQERINSSKQTSQKASPRAKMSRAA